MRSLKSNSLKDLKLLLGEEKVYVVTEEDEINETTAILATFKTFLGAQRFAKARIEEAATSEESIEISQFGFTLISRIEGNEVYHVSIKGFTLNA